MLTFLFRRRGNYGMADEKRSRGPVLPEISIYPNKMSVKRALFEARRARKQGYCLPLGHPYRVAPGWMPYAIARVIGSIDRLIG